MSLKRLAHRVIGLQDHILFALFEEGGVVLNLEDRMSYALNETGAGIILLLDGKRDVMEVIRHFACGCNMREESIYEDVVNFLTDLQERGWVYVR